MDNSSCEKDLDCSDEEPRPASSRARMRGGANDHERPPTSPVRPNHKRMNESRLRLSVPPRPQYQRDPSEHRLLPALSEQARRDDVGRHAHNSRARQRPRRPNPPPHRRRLASIGRPAGESAGPRRKPRGTEREMVPRGNAGGEQRDRTTGESDKGAAGRGPGGERPAAFRVCAGVPDGCLTNSAAPRSPQRGPQSPEERRCFGARGFSAFACVSRRLCASERYFAQGAEKPAVVGSSSQWERLDSNQRRHTSTGLQPIPQGGSHVLGSRQTSSCARPCMADAANQALICAAVCAFPASNKWPYRSSETVTLEWPRITVRSLIPIPLAAK